MWRRIKRAYYEWVIRNCIEDIRELNKLSREWKDISPFMRNEIAEDIREARQEMDEARAKL